MLRTLNLLFIWVLCGVLLAGFLYQFIEKEDPCSLCLLQRLAMIAIAISLFLNLKFGIKITHYAMALLAALFGMATSLRQIALHICLTFPTFGTPIFGLDLYAWSFIVFFCSIFSCSILLILHKETPPTFRTPEKMTLTLLALLSIANILTAIQKFDIFYP
jgi:disulfide bond formation protein DsbB